MDISLVNDEIVLEPDVPGEVLVDVVNTDDVIDAVEFGIDGVPGTTVALNGTTSTLFPGERRRLPVQVRLPSEVVAGRHHLRVLVRSSGTQTQQSAGLTVDVRPRPGLAAVARPSVQGSRHRVVFPVTVANRGNTPLNLEFRELDAPDGLTLTLDPEESVLPPWQTMSCQAAVFAPRFLIGTAREHLIDLRVGAWSSTPGQPLMQQEIGREARLTFRQRPVIGGGALLALVLLLVLAVWGALSILGLREFVNVDAAPLSEADTFNPSSALARQDPGYSDVTITIFGRVVSEVDGYPLRGVPVRACTTDAEMLKEKPCSEKVLSDGNGNFWVSGLIPGPYRLSFAPQDGKPVHLPVTWYTASCSRQVALPSGSRTMTLKVLLHGELAAGGDVSVAARLSNFTGGSAATPTPSAVPTTQAPVLPPEKCPSAGQRAPGPAAPSQDPAGGEPGTAVVMVEPGKNGTAESPVLVLPGLSAPGHYVLTITTQGQCMMTEPLALEPLPRGKTAEPWPIPFGATPGVGECPA